MKTAIVDHRFKAKTPRVFKVM